MRAQVDNSHWPDLGEVDIYLLTRPMVRGIECANSDGLYPPWIRDVGGGGS